jgi:chloramphenicol-sensitive protein RarD
MSFNHKESSYNQGIVYALACYVAWGLFPVFWKAITGVPALAVETMMVFPFALAFLFYTAESSAATPFSPSSALTSLLLIVSGLVTAIPLFWFGKSAQVIPLSTMGFIQYVSPTLQLLLGIFVYDETFGIEYFICFTFVWTGLMFYTISIFKGKKATIAK